MSGKVIQGSFVEGRPKWSSSVQPKDCPFIVSDHTRARIFRPSASGAGRCRPTRTVRRYGAFAVEAGPLGLVSSGGRPLPDAGRGQNGSRVRRRFLGCAVHVGPQAERIGAVAFTVGSDVSAPKAMRVLGRTYWYVNACYRN